MTMPRIAIPKSVANEIRDRVDGLPFSSELEQLGPDIWVANRPISMHTDSTKAGLASYFLVLINDLNLHLLYEGDRIQLAVGGVYRINARLPHSAETERRDSGGLFAALIWDMPETTSMASFAAQAKIRLAELTADRFDEARDDE